MTFGSRGSVVSTGQVCESLVMMVRLAIAAALLTASCSGGPKGYRASADSCTCTGVDGGTLTVTGLSFTIIECGPPPEQIVQDCEVTTFPNVRFVFADAGCDLLVTPTCHCTARPALETDCD
jgi:hypothetical protein